VKRSGAVSDILPHSAEAERAVLGSLLLRSEGFADCGLKPNDFFLAPNREIFRAIAELAARNETADLVTVAAALEDSGKTDAAGGEGYLASLVDGVPRVANLHSYATILHNLSIRRQVLYAVEAIAERARQPERLPGDESSGDLAADLRAAVTEITASSNGNGSSALGMSLLEFLQRDYPEPDYLIDGVIPRGEATMVFAKPHHLKSFLTLGLALEASAPGKAMGALSVRKPVRTIAVQIEDPPGRVKRRVADLLLTEQYGRCDLRNVWVITRAELDPQRGDWMDRLLGSIERFKADWVILDVLRRFFPAGQDINSPGDAAAFLERVDRVRVGSGCAVTLVHHQAKRDGGDIFTSSMGSGYVSSWAKVSMWLTNLSRTAGRTSVDMEITSGVGLAPDPMRLVFEPAARFPLLLLSVADEDAIAELKLKMGDEWTLRDLAEARDIHKSNAWRMVKKWLDSGVVEKVRSAKPTRGGMAHFRFTLQNPA
jgi:hypothetical protein